MPGAGRFIFVGWASPTDASLRGQGRRAMPTLRWLTQRRAEYKTPAVRAGTGISVGQAFQPDTLKSQAGKPDLLKVLFV